MKKLNKGLLLSVFLVFTFLVSVSFVNSALTTITIIDPSASSSVTGSTTFNATTSSNVTGYLNCSWYIQSVSLTANTTWTKIIDQASNTTNGAGHFNMTWDTSGVEDATDYVINVSCNNGTNIIENTITALTIDNTVPTTPSSLSPSASSTEEDDSVTFSTTVTGRETTSCTLYFPTKNPGSSSYSMTHTGDTCTHTLTMPEETYDYYIQASDGTNTTNSAVTRFGISVDTPSNYLFQEKTTKPFVDSTLSVVTDKTIGGIPNWVFIVLIGGMVVFLIKKRK